MGRSNGQVTQSNTASQIGRTLPQVPRGLASLFVEQGLYADALAGLGFGGNMRYIGRSFGDTATTLAIPDSPLFDLAIRYDLGEAHPTLEWLMVSVNARDIADKRCVATRAGTAACDYGQGRGLTARRWPPRPGSSSARMC